MQDTVEMHESDEFPGEFETDVATFVDPRTKLMGVRILCAGETLEIDDSEFKEQKDMEEYTLIR